MEVHSVALTPKIRTKIDGLKVRSLDDVVPDLVAIFGVLFALAIFKFLDLCTIAVLPFWWVWAVKVAILAAISLAFAVILARTGKRLLGIGEAVRALEADVSHLVELVEARNEIDVGSAGPPAP